MFSLSLAAPRLSHAISQVEPIALARTALVAASHAVSTGFLIVGVYLAKSAAGINLLPGPSPLHDLFYHLVR